MKFKAAQRSKVVALKLSDASALATAAIKIIARINPCLSKCLQNSR
jgi:hypothetical protein